MALKSYAHIFFDLDHTLWDYQTAARETIQELYDHYNLGEKGEFSKDELVEKFFEVNNQLWTELDQNLIDKIYLRENRFQLIFDQLKLPLRHYPYGFEANYLETCPAKPYIIEYAAEILDYLKTKYQLHIITNGFKDVQFIKLKNANLQSYFEQVITSHSRSFRKPEPEIFQFALDKAGTRKEDAIMIGDNLLTDIQGASDFGIDQVYFNPSETPHNYSPTYEINRLLDLKEIL